MHLTCNGLGAAEQSYHEEILNQISFPTVTDLSGDVELNPGPLETCEEIVKELLGWQDHIKILPINCGSSKKRPKMRSFLEKNGQATKTAQCKQKVVQLCTSKTQGRSRFSASKLLRGVCVQLLPVYGRKATNLILCDAYNRNKNIYSP